MCLPPGHMAFNRPIKCDSKIQRHIEQDFLSLHRVSSKYTQSECGPKIERKVFETGSCLIHLELNIAQAGHMIVIILPQQPEIWDY